MKRIIGLLILVFTVSLITGCVGSSHINLVRGKDGNVITSNYHRKVYGVIFDKESAESWAYADQTARGGYAQSVNSSNVFMKNSSSYNIEVIDGHFRGLVLEPGEKSNYRKSVPLGSYTFDLRWVDSRGRLKQWPVSRLITKNTKKIEIKNR